VAYRADKGQVQPSLIDIGRVTCVTAMCPRIAATISLPNRYHAEMITD